MEPSSVRRRLVAVVAALLCAGARAARGAPGDGGDLNGAPPADFARTISAQKTLDAKMPVVVQSPPRGAPADPDGAGWVEMGMLRTVSSNTYTYFSGQWSVPLSTPPLQNGQTVYFWLGLEPKDGSCVLQSVLGFDNAWNPPWHVRSWITCASVYMSPAVGVAPGDRISGTVSLNDGTWTVVTTDVTSGRSATLQAPFSVTGAQTWPMVVLEVHTQSGNAFGCANYPASGPVVFDHLSLVDTVSRAFTPDMIPYQYKNFGCGEKVSTSPGAVSLDY
jgi:hypothetical protein